AFGADAVWLTPRCADPLYRKSVRVSMGGSLFVPWARVDDAGDAAERLRARGLRVLALTPDAQAAPLAGVAPGLPGRGTALLLG
ncbi:TrmH family RNA methyltransferase, partial [Escherichia coli]|uniref:TrmH family RNA methyltransferase n=1 Tax=Escherichia coli TaxID=562 RepID=UPI0028DF354C